MKLVWVKSVNVQKLTSAWILDALLMAHAETQLKIAQLWVLVLPLHLWNAKMDLVSQVWVNAWRSLTVLQDLKIAQMEVALTLWNALRWQPVLLHSLTRVSREHVKKLKLKYSREPHLVNKVVPHSTCVPMESVSVIELNARATKYVPLQDQSSAQLSIVWRTSVTASKEMEQLDVPKISSCVMWRLVNVNQILLNVVINHALQT